MIPRAPLGSTGLEITRVGFGAWAIGGGGWRHGWGEQDDRQSLAALRAAVDAGVNWVDTAAVYGLGHSEEIVGRALRDLPEADRPYVFTKCGLRFDPAKPRSEPNNVMRSQSVREEVTASLRRLGVERIDLYQVHWPPEDGTPLEEYWSTMDELRREGLVRAIGLSNHDRAQLLAAEKIAHVDSLQPPFSMIHRGSADLIAAAGDLDTGVIVYSPMQSGLLSGSMTLERVAAMPDNDWRAGHDDFNDMNLKRNLALADALRPLAERRDVPLAALAVAWTLQWPGVSGAIVGARNPAQIGDWLPAAELLLSEAELEEIAQIIAACGAGEGPTVPRRAGVS